ncbi:hypothetical protein, partial [Chryseobacterium sp. SIMBA_029]
VNVTVPPVTSVGTIQPFQISGVFDDRTGTVFANYVTADDSGTISFLDFFPDYLNEQGTLPRTVGSYSVKQKSTVLSVGANGNTSFRDV